MTVEELQTRWLERLSVTPRQPVSVKDIEPLKGGYKQILKTPSPAMTPRYMFNLFAWRMEDSRKGLYQVHIYFRVLLCIYNRIFVKGLGREC